MNTRQARPTLPSLGTVSEFSLTTQAHRQFTDANLKNKVNILDFIFTTCAGPCPLMSGKMQEMQQQLKNESLVQFVSFSVDPETDTPEVLTEYAKRFGGVTDNWTFLTGDKKIIYDLIRSGFHLTIDADENAIAHSTKFVLVDRQATIRGYYDSEDDSSMTRLIGDARSLAQE
jgi:protein SCO1/2